MNEIECDFSSVKKIGFIGFGLIGGSIARALKQYHPDYNLCAYYYRKDNISADLQAALSDSILDSVTFSLTDEIADVDILFLCAPVLSNISYLKQLKSIIKPSCILTDVGSVKGNIHKAVKELNLESQFIGGHPMTGSEKTGYLNSYAILLENSYYILTPTDCVPKEHVNLLYGLVKSLGSIPIILDPLEHDQITAAISHVPHIIAAQLVNLIREDENKADKMKLLAAGGFKDITRIASASPVMWQDICLTNRDEIIESLERYISSLETVKKALSSDNGDYLYEMFDLAGDFRNSIPNQSKGLIKRNYEIYLDIRDEAGAIATIATMLASNQISIKNIGIIHNREFQEGVLKIEFYEEEAKDKAVILLSRYNYRLYQRQ